MTDRIDADAVRLWLSVMTDDAEVNDGSGWADGRALGELPRVKLESMILRAREVVAEMGDGVSPECSGFAEVLDGILSGERES